MTRYDVDIFIFTGACLGGFLTSLIAKRLSRSDEYEADAYASALLTKSGIGTTPQINLFHKLDRLTASNSGAVTAWLMSHPKTSDRIKAIEKNEASWNQST